MSQHAGLFFPEREWLAEKDILLNVSASKRCFLSQVTFLSFKYTPFIYFIKKS